MIAKAQAAYPRPGRKGTPSPRAVKWIQRVRDAHQRLIEEKSPYLLQHAHNPVDWYPWGEEAFAKARDGEQADLLSIGYSTCHWCHVMERESFENEQIADILNEHFVPSRWTARSGPMWTGST